MKKATKTIGGVEWECVILGGRAILTAVMTYGLVDAFGEIFSGMKARGFEVEIVRHEDDAEIADAGEAFVIMRELAA